jgi:hypothetical protein
LLPNEHRIAVTAIVYARRPVMKRILVVLALSVAMAACNLIVPAKIDQAKFEQVHRAGRDIREHVTSGVSLITYRDLVGKYATEVSLAADKSQSQLERQFTAQHALALQAFRDCLTIWNRKIQDSRTYLTAAEPEMKRIADTYSVDGSGTGDSFSFGIDGAIQTIWQKADVFLNRADALYRGDPDAGKDLIQKTASAVEINRSEPPANPQPTAPTKTEAQAPSPAVDKPATAPRPKPSGQAAAVPTSPRVARDLVGRQISLVELQLGEKAPNQHPGTAMTRLAGNVCT